MAGSRDIEWRWADADGTEHAIGDAALRSALTDERLPAFALVWRRGWARWQHACRAEELRDAVPEAQREPPERPAASTSGKPPRAPVERYARFAARSELAERFSTARGLVNEGASRAAALVGAAGPMRAPPPPAIRSRTPMPTLGDIAPPTPTRTLRPPGAVPPPPRAVPRASDDDDDEPVRSARIVAIEPEPPTNPANPLPQPPETPEPPAPTAAAPPPVEAVAPTPSPPPAAPVAASAPASPEPAPDSAPLPQFELDESSSAPPVPPAAVPPNIAGLAPAPAPAAKPVSIVTLLTGILAVVAGLLAIIVVVLVLRQPDAPAVTSNVPSSAAPGPASAAPAGSAATAGAAPVRQCKLASEAKRLSDAVYIGVPPVLAASGEKVALGFAATRTTAMGLLIDASDLSAKAPFRDSGRPLFSVVPSAAADRGFIGDRDSARVAYARTVAAEKPFTIGLGDSALARTSEGGRPETIWKLEAGSRITTPRVASNDSGHLVTFRVGKLDGTIYTGWLERDGSRSSDLARVASDTTQLGTPSAAANASSGLVAFAARRTATDPWGVYLGAAPVGTPPTEAKRVDPPPGGPGGATISPAAHGVGNDHWLLQWTEGSTGNRAVRVQLLDAQLEPVGDAVRVSPESENSGQGSIWTDGQHALSVFMVQKGRDYELWGASLRCR